MQNYKLLLIAGISVFIIVILGLVVGANTNNKVIEPLPIVEPIQETNPIIVDGEEPDYKFCRSDEECVSVPAGCCGCNAGGTNTAVNSKYKEKWNSDIAKDCAAVSCMQVYVCDDSMPKCVNNTCTLSSGNNAN